MQSYTPEIMGKRLQMLRELDPKLPRGAASVTVTLDDGRVLTRTVLHARGSLQRPLSDREIEEKVRAAAAFGAASSPRKQAPRPRAAS